MNIEWLNLHPTNVTHPGMWDDTFLQEVLAGVHGPVPDGGTVAVIPGRYHALDIATINRRLQKHDGVLVIVTADEENVFPTDLIEHQNAVVWVQTLRPGRFDRGFGRFPLGYPPDTRSILQGIWSDFETPWPTPLRDWWFSGQVTHERRKQAVEALSALPRGKLVETPGFTQGISRTDFLVRMMWAKTAPCPSGPATQECFRMWEALQAGSIPILDASTPDRVNDGYWYPLLGGDHPLPVVEDWNTVGGVIDSLVAGWPHTSNRVQAWWTRYRRSWPAKVTQALLDVTPHLPDPTPPVTVLVPTSPVPSHPDTSIIEQTYDSIRQRFTTADIRIMVDGVRPEQWDRMPDYQEYTRRLLWLANNAWHNVQVTVHDTHMHQARMTRHELQTVETPLILFVEHDAPLFGDWPVQQLVDLLLDKDGPELVRMNHDYQIHPEHTHLMLDDTPQERGGLPMIRTLQWSQRPHLARTDRYRHWLTRWFTLEERGMIEDRMHSIVQQHPAAFNLLLYAPEGNQQRSIHLDARGTDRKWVLG